MTTSYDNVLYSVRESVAEITLNRPDKLNAISAAVHRDLLAALKTAGADQQIRSVVISGAGRAFCAGGDIRNPDADSGSVNPRDLASAIWDMPKPVIAKVHGYCLGQACEFAAVCDLTVASEDAMFGEVEVTNGWGPPIVITPYVMSLKHAAEFLMLGEMISAAEAHRIGLVNRVVPLDQLDAAVDKITSRLNNFTPEILASDKRLLHQVYEVSGYDQARNWDFLRPAGAS
ncbi:enoyl-CoA hydratase/isomerase family protein [Jatrophihabitans sp. DSM 45814]